MRHGDDRLFHAGLAALLHEVVEKRDQTVAALEREALLPDVFGVQIPFQTLGGGQLPQDVPLLLDGKLPLEARRLKLVLEPQALFGV